MLFYSNTFLIFFAVFMFLWSMVPAPWRLGAVFLASCIFYAWWCPFYIFLLLALVLLSYYGAFKVPRMPRWQFAATLLLVFSPLIFYKYASFILQNVSDRWAEQWASHGRWALPIGISFITFTVASYLIDVRKKLIQPEQGFLRYCVFVSFFPHLIAGPIMRARELLPQLGHLAVQQRFFKLGLSLFAIGMLKKMVFADQIGFYVDRFYGAQDSLNFYQSLFTFYGFAVQIYCDFSGYVDMAYGLAFMMGIRLPLNFNRPYAARSVRDFWRRWHITLSRWLKDYLYIPLGGNRRGFGRRLLNIMVTMALGGLWHGASWMFVLWGICHGLYLVVERVFSRLWPSVKMPLWLAKLITFHAVALAWMLFRSRDWGQLKHVLGGFSQWGGFSLFSMTLFPVLLIILAFLAHPWDRLSLEIRAAKKLPGALIVAGSIGLMILSKVLSIDGARAFIYFDF